MDIYIYVCGGALWLMTVAGKYQLTFPKKRSEGLSWKEVNSSRASGMAWDCGTVRTQLRGAREPHEAWSEEEEKGS